MSFVMPLPLPSVRASARKGDPKLSPVEILDIPTAPQGSPQGGTAASTTQQVSGANVEVREEQEVQGGSADVEEDEVDDDLDLDEHDYQVPAGEDILEG